MENIEKTYCPHCGVDVTNEEETEYGIFCPNGCGDFWRSETIPENDLELYTYDEKFNMMIRG